MISSALAARTSYSELVKAATRREEFNNYVIGGRAVGAIALGLALGAGANKLKRDSALKDIKQQDFLKEVVAKGQDAGRPLEAWKTPGDRLVDHMELMPDKDTHMGTDVFATPGKHVQIHKPKGVKDDIYPRYRLGLSSTNPYVAGHELGHAQIHDSMRKLFFGKQDTPQAWKTTGHIHNLLYGALPFIGGAGSIIAAARGVQNPWLLYGLPAATSIPQLLIEGTASLRGLKNAERLGADRLTPAQRRRAKLALGLAFGSYAVSPALTMAANYLISGNRPAPIPPPAGLSLKFLGL